MQNAETVLGVLRGSLQSPVPRNGHAGFGGRPHGKGPAERQAPRRAVDPTFSMHRWRTAAGTGAHLIWRVKNGAKSLPAKVITTLADGSHLVRLRESDAMLSARRKASQDKTIPRLGDITASPGRVHRHRRRPRWADPDQPVPGPDHAAGPRLLPRRPGRGLLRATLAGRTGLQDNQVHAARVRASTPRTGP